MYLPTFDPNRSKAPFGQTSSAEQALIIKKIAWELCGSDMFDATGTGIVLVDEPRGKDHLATLSHIEGRDCADPIAEAEKRHPDGYWGIMVTANMGNGRGIPTHTDTPLGEYILSLIAIGAFPREVGKIALLTSDENVNWLGGLDILNKAGIHLISDYKNTFSEDRVDPLGFVDKFVRTTRYKIEARELSEKTASEIGDDLVESIATAFAVHSILMSVRTPGIRSGKNTLIGNTCSQLSLGKLSLPEKADTRTSSYLPEPFANGRYVPPKGHAACEIVETGQKTTLLIRAWMAYLAGYGITLDLTQNFNIAPFACPDMKALVDEIVKSPYDDEASDYIVQKAALIVPREDDAMLTSFPKTIGKMRSWRTDTPSRNQSYVRKGSGTSSPTPKSSAIDKAVLDLKRLMVEATGVPGDNFITDFEIMENGDIYRGAEAFATSLSEFVPDDDWLLVTSSRLENWGSANEILIAIAAGMIDIERNCGVVLLRYDFAGDDKACQVIAELVGAGVEHVADYGNDFDCPSLDDISRLRPVNGTISGNPKTTIALKGKEMADPKVLDLFGEEGRALVIEERKKQIGLALNTFLPDHAECAIRLITGKSITFPGTWETSSRTRAHSNGIFSVLEPAGEFFEIEDAAELDYAISALKIWKALLKESGFALSPRFPIGVSECLFEKAKKIFGLASYLEALDADVPLEDIIAAEDEYDDLW